MSAPVDLAAAASVRQFLERVRNQAVPLSGSFFYYSAVPSLSDEDVKEYLEEPASALPLPVRALLPTLYVLLVPYLDRPTGKDRENTHAETRVLLSKPEDPTIGYAIQAIDDKTLVLAFAMEEQNVADFHYRLYHAIAVVLADLIPDDISRKYQGLLREEFNGEVNGEVDEESWRLKQTLLRRQSTVRRDTKPFLAYARQSLIDTLTLYLHGICCDIDVETGPRQIPSRFLRKRLVLLQQSFPPPSGYVVFPEELQKA